MVARFLLVAFADTSGTEEAGRAANWTATSHGLTLLQTGPRWQLFANEAARPLALSRGRGVVVGRLFRKDASQAAVAALTPREEDAIAGSQGSILGDSFWGNYVAMLGDPHNGTIAVARAPFGGLPAYVLQDEGVTYVASHVDLLLAASGAPRGIDWAAVGSHLIAPNLRRERTCREGITEIIGGFRYRIEPGAVVPRPFWTPWPFARQEMRVSDPDEAIEGVRRTAETCVSALASDTRHAVLGISGGLDSSIVAACLANSATRVTCLTLYSADASGDERPYARDLAAHLGFPLVEMAETVDRVDVTRSDATHLPRPLARSFAQSGDRSNLAVADQLGADGFFSGGGGDNVFCYIQSAVPVADRLLTSGLGRAAWRTAHDISRLADCSVLAALRSGAERAWMRDHQYRWKPELSYLTEQARGSSEDACTPIWADMPDDVLPGSSNHVAWLVGTLNYLEGFGRERTHPTFWPLLAQPLVEFCLRIPSWAWCAGGNNRMIARRAFADRLPPSVIGRRSKGTPDSFMVQLFEANRVRLADLLSSGMLARQGLIDISAILDQLRDTRPVEGLSYWRILGLADVEAWLQGVTGSPSTASPASAHIGAP